jgi:hypothetical protein
MARWCAPAALAEGKRRGWPARQAGRRARPSHSSTRTPALQSTVPRAGDRSRCWRLGPQVERHHRCASLLPAACTASPLASMPPRLFPVLPARAGCCAPGWANVVVLVAGPDLGLLEEAIAPQLPAGELPRPGPGRRGLLVHQPEHHRPVPWRRCRADPPSRAGSCRNSCRAAPGCAHGHGGEPKDGPLALRGAPRYLQLLPRPSWPQCSWRLILGSCVSCSMSTLRS